MASELKAVCQSVDPARCGVRSNKEGLNRRFAGLRTLRKIAILPWLKQDQFAGNRNTGCQDNIQAGLAVVSKCHTNPGPVGVFFALHIRRAFLGDKYVVDGFSHELSSHQNDND